MPKAKKQTKIITKLSKAAETAIEKESQEFLKLSLAKQKKLFTSICNHSEHHSEVAILVGFSRYVLEQLAIVTERYSQLAKEQQKK